MIFKAVEEQSVPELTELAALARPALDSLNIDPSPEDMREIGKAILNYYPFIKKDMVKLKQMISALQNYQKQRHRLLKDKQVVKPYWMLTSGQQIDNKTVNVLRDAEKARRARSSTNSIRN